MRISMDLYWDAIGHGFDFRWNTVKMFFEWGKCKTVNAFTMHLHLVVLPAVLSIISIPSHVLIGHRHFSSDPSMVHRENQLTHGPQKSATCNGRKSTVMDRHWKDIKEPPGAPVRTHG